MTRRIIGYDFARALAIFGMVLVNYKIVLGSAFGNPSLNYLVSLLEGRASALFVVLAGVGISLLTQQARLQNNNIILLQKRVTLLKRGGLLFIIGLLFSTIWPADILHFYGLYFAIAALFINASNNKLCLAMLFSCLTFILLLFVLNYESGWDFTTLNYLDFWTLEGMFRHIFFNGFHPVIPWISFIFIGMWLGRQDLARRKTRLAIFTLSTLTWLLTEAGIYILSQNISASADTLSLLSTSMMPPMPQYIIAAASLAISMTCLSIELTQQYKETRLIHWLVCVGKLPLTLYIAHVIIGMGLMSQFNLLHTQSIEVAVLSALLFCLTAIIFSALWLKRFNMGPIEKLFRVLTG